MSSFGRFGNNQDHAVGEFSVCIKPLDGKDHARKRALTVKSWSTVKDLKDILQSLLHIPAASQRLFFRGGELRNPHTLQDCGIYRDGQTVYLASSPQDEMGKPYSLEPFLGTGALPRSLARVLGQARRGLDRGFKPELTLEGTGGTYFLHDATRQKVAVFKPQDEEPFAPNNPRDAMQGGLGGGTVSMRPGIDAGESYVREVAAYLLDDRHLHGVPPTTLVEAKHPGFCYWDHKERMKLGSFQEFVRHDMVVEDISPSRLTPREVQKIALLDMRILNRDRNSVNILVRSRPRRSSSFSDRSRALSSGGGSGSSQHIRHGSSDSNISLSMAAMAVSGGSSGSAMGMPGCSRGSGSGGINGGERRSRLLGGSTEYELIPIDHGLCLSDELVIDWCDWCWLDWPQVKEPIDPELANYIQSFNPEATAEKLGNTLNLQEPCLRNLRIAETLLKEGVAAGLTLYDIACVIRREDFDKISDLEALVARANELARAAVDHQTSVAPSRRTLNVTSKSVGSNKARPRPAHRSGSSSVDFAAEDKDGWLVTAAQEEAIGAGRRPHPRSVAYRRESSTDASSEDAPSLLDLRASGDSMEGSGGEGGEGPLRIWAPGATTLSRESSSSAEVAFLTGRDDRYSSPPRSAESETDIISPVGFWHEKFETIDARNATRKFSGWGDNDSGEEVYPEGAGTQSGAVGGRVDCAGWAAGGFCTPGKDGEHPGAAVRDHADGAVGVCVERKLFESPDKQRPTPPAINKTTKPLSANLEPMAEGDHESPSPMGPPGGGTHPPPFWAAPVEAARDTLGRGVGGFSGGGLDDKEAGGLGWRRGEAGLVVPEPLPPKSRSVTIQQVVPQRAPRIVDTAGGAGGEEKCPLSAPRPATTSPTLPTPGDHAATAPKGLHVLSKGVKIVRSYSYHGLGSMALYDAASRGNALYSLRKRRNENSEQFKACFFRFLRFLLRDLVKRRHRSIVKTRGAQAARHAAEKSSKSTAAAAARAASAAGGGRRGDYGTDNRLRGRAPPPPPAAGPDVSPRPAVPAAVRG